MKKKFKLLCICLLFTSFSKGQFLNTNWSRKDGEPVYPYNNNQKSFSEIINNVNKHHYSTDDVTGDNGDLHLCPFKLQLFSQLGKGWDNLDNTIKLSVFQNDYKLCQDITDDKDKEDKYFNSAPVISYNPPMIQSKTELFDSWNKYSSAVANSINQDGDTKFSALGLSGSFSEEMRKLKKIKVKKRVNIVRVLLRYIYYIVGLSEKAPLTYHFRQAVLEIVKNTEENSIKSVQYYAESLIQRYGTHFINLMDVGGAIAQEDGLLVKEMLKFEEFKDEATIVNAAAILFYNTISTNLISQSVMNNTILKTYEKFRAYQNIRLYGGFQLDKTITFKNWSASIPANMTAINYQGHFLWDAINVQNFPELSKKNLLLVRKEIYKAIKTYYTNNIHPGCINLDSPNFSFLANQDDGSCTIFVRNYSFGGMFQMCQPRNIDGGNLCFENNLTIANPVTNNFSCSENYKAVFLMKGNVTKAKRTYDCMQRCSGAWIFKTCTEECLNKLLYSSVQYMIYWCAAMTSTENLTTGIHFGGIFTKMLKNLVTNSFTCPEHFKSLTFSNNMTVCVRSNETVNSSLSIPFGGFYTCSRGNPLPMYESGLFNDINAFRNAVERKMNVSATNKSVNSSLLNRLNHSINSIQGSNQRSLIFSCPSGYQRSLLSSNDDCSIFYCIKITNFINKFNLPNLLTPPFSSYYRESPIMEPYQKPSSTDKTVLEGRLDREVIIGTIIVSVVLIVILLLSIVMYFMKRFGRKVTNSHEYSESES